ncbi:uncharacterized protein LOC132697757 isoform X2 [Cylas formicarius]|uniref:uncharacterized protein LOC132697757 isoform X2 n=1 Tax=Cylas formicarius TaxID=197179 RepID=UPI002958B70F|nr:uncharacterized protein LOC132697757 isoform X2 [Cylas formicarius]
MLREWLNYLLVVLLQYFYTPTRSIDGSSKTSQSPFGSEPSIAYRNMSDMQVSVPGSTAVSTGSGNREEESELTEETTLSEVRKDLGHAKMHEKTATFESQENTSIKEDHRSQQTEASKSVMQQETCTISGNTKDWEEKQSTRRPHSLYEPLESIKPFEPLKPFEPIKPFEPVKPFEPLQPFDAPKSFQLTKQIETQKSENSLKDINSSVNSTVQDNVGSLPLGYVPVEPLSPLILSDLEPKLESGNSLPPLITFTDLSVNNSAEIKEENIKNTLREIISDLDSYAEKDKEVKREGLENGSAPTALAQSFMRKMNDELISKYGNEDRGQDENAPPSKPINLEKIFTPADGEQIQPRANRKMFASSAFYDKGFHPTVEDQVQLAKRISSSLSDISNQSSKGLQMYVNRKKRSVKWVHEGEGKANINGSETNGDGSGKPKDPLKLVMNPAGQVQDINTLRKQGHTFETILSPEVCLEIVKDLNSPKGKGAELFAKRRKRSEKWVVGETNGTRPSSTLPDAIAPSPTPISNPLPPLNNLPPLSYLPETAQRLQHKEKLDEIQEKFTRPRIKLVKSPWDAALETGSVDAAFEIEPVWPTKGIIVAPAVDSYEAALKSDSLASWTGSKNNGDQKIYAHNPAYNSQSINRIVENLQKGTGNVDVYKPSLPQSWNSDPARKQHYSSVTPSANNTLMQPASLDASDEPTLPFPTIPDESRIMQQLIPTTTEELGQPQDRPKSPFPMIPDVNLEDELVTQDIVNFQRDQCLESSLRPTSPFPNIPDITLNPEVIERDIVALRTSPIPFKVEDSEPPTPILKQTFPFPEIPNISKYLAVEQASTLFKPITLKKAEPKSSPPLKPEFGYALPYPEVTYSEHTFNNSRMIQSEMFESEGHFNARSATPIKVFIPNEVETKIAEEAVESKESEKTKIIIEKVQVDAKNPRCEEQVKKIVTQTDREKSGVMVTQKQCFKELENIKTAYNMADRYALKGVDKVEYIDPSDGFDNILSDMKRTQEGVHENRPTPAEDFAANAESSANYNSVLPTKDNRQRGTENTGSNSTDIAYQAANSIKTNNGNYRNRETSLMEVADEPNSSSNTGNATKSAQNDEMELDIEPKICKKPPGAIMGAKPLFGELDINDEFKKALVGRKKSIQQKRSKNVTHNKTPGGSTSEVNQVEYREEATDSSSLKTGLVTNEKAQIDVIRLNENEEIEKIFYQRDREYDIDFQIIQEDVGNEQGPEDYVKLPVRHLIKNFEQTIMPQMHYKQIRDPLPDVVEKIAPKHASQNAIQKQLRDQNLAEAEEAFNNLYYVASSTVQNNHRSPDSTKAYALQQSENSSFCKYSSLESYHQSQAYSSSSFRPIDVADSNANGQHAQGSSTLPRPQQKPALSPSYKPNTSPSVFVPKESTSPLPNPYYPAYNATPAYNYQPPSHTYDDSFLATPLPPTTKKISFDDLQNYNTAPRGWGDVKDVYRPLTFDKPKSPYSDF